MNFISIALGLFLSLTSFANQDCNSSWQLIGKIDSEVQAYDEFVAHVSKEKANIQLINEQIQKTGLIQMTGVTGKIQGFPNRLQGDSPSGETAGVFLKKLELPKKSNLILDFVYEVSDLKAKKSIRQWNLPYGSNGPQAIEGNQVTYLGSISAVCNSASLAIVFKVTPDHRYQAVEGEQAKSTTPTLVQPCIAAKNLFKKSDYSVCGEFIDLKTKKKRLLVWQTPTT